MKYVKDLIIGDILRHKTSNALYKVVETYSSDAMLAPADIGGIGFKIYNSDLHDYETPDLDARMEETRRVGDRVNRLKGINLTSDEAKQQWTEEQLADKPIFYKNEVYLNNKEFIQLKSELAEIKWQKLNLEEENKQLKTLLAESPQTVNVKLVEMIKRQDKEIPSLEKQLRYMDNENLRLEQKLFDIADILG